MSHAPFSRRHLAVGAVTLALGLGGLAACSSSNDDSSSSTTTVTSTAPGTDESDVGVTTTTGADSATTTSPEVDAATTTTPTKAPATTTTDPGPAPSGDAAAYVAAMRASLDDGEGTFTAGELDCMASGLVGTVGADRWRAAGVDAPDLESGNPFEGLGLDDATATALYDVMHRCSGGLRQAIVRAFAGSGDPEQTACVDAIITDDLLRDLLIGTFRGEAGSDDVLDALDACR